MQEVSKKLSIGVYDSGLGGLSVLKELFFLPANTELYYLTDQAHSPYGDLSEELIRSRGIKMVQRLEEKNVDLVVVACNTATAHAIDDLRQKFSIPFVGIEPYLNYINHTEEKGAFGVLTTPATAISERFLKLRKVYDPEGEIQVFPMPKLASLIEKLNPWHSQIQSREQILGEIEAELSSLKNAQLSHLILGCTHYPLISKAIENFLSVSTIDPGRAVAKQVAKTLGVNLTKTMGITQFWMDDLEGKSWVLRQSSELDLLPDGP